MMCVDVLWMSKFNDIFQFFEKLKSFDNFEDSLSSCLFLRTEMDPSKEEKTCDGCDKVVKEEVQYANQTFCGDCFRKKINKLPLPKEIAKQEKGKKGSKPKKVALCSYADLQRHGKILGRVGWRSVAVFCVRGKVYAVDNLCYHAGGPLIEGDIEDLGNGRTCVRCPWHSYRIDLRNGEGILVDRSGRFLQSKGKRQRTHTVTIENGDVYVELNLEGEKLASDSYC